jgi:hypothetical protein
MNHVYFMWTAVGFIHDAEEPEAHGSRNLGGLASIVVHVSHRLCGPLRPGHSSWLTSHIQLQDFSRIYLKLLKIL